MNRWSITLFTFYGLMLASVLFPASDAFASYPTSCTPTCLASCPYCASGNPNIHTLPVTVYPDPNCTGVPSEVHTLPYTDGAGVVQHAIPSTWTITGSVAETNPQVICSNPTPVCDTATGDCCAPDNSCAATICNITSCTNNCNQIITGTIIPDNSCAASTCNTTNCTNNCGQSVPGTVNCTCSNFINYSTAPCNDTYDGSCGNCTGPCQVSNSLPLYSYQWCFASNLSGLSDSCTWADPNYPYTCTPTVSTSTVGCSYTTNHMTACGFYSNAASACYNDTTTNCATGCSSSALTYWDPSQCSCECDGGAINLTNDGQNEYDTNIDNWSCSCPGGQINNGTGGCRNCNWCPPEDDPSGPVVCC